MSRIEREVATLSSMVIGTNPNLVFLKMSSATLKDSLASTNGEEWLMIATRSDWNQLAVLEDGPYDVLASYSANWFLAVKDHKPIDITAARWPETFLPAIANLMGRRSKPPA